MLNVLLVDDEYMVISGLKCLIPWEELGLNLIGTAFNGEEALEIIEQKKVDIVISDVTMPIMSGIEFLREARSRNKKFQIIYLSGYQEFEFAKEGMALGAINYLLKPVDKKELIASLTEAIKKVRDTDNVKKIIHFEKRRKIKDWLENGISEDTANYFNIEKGTSFNVFVGTYESDHFLKFLDKKINLFYFTEGKKRIIGIILNETKSDLKDYYIDLAKKFPEKLFLFSGPLVSTPDKLKKSYEVAKSLEDSYYFYNLVQEGCIWIELNNHLEEIYYNNNEELPLLSKLAKQDSLENNINSIINFFNRTPIPPNHVRYFTLLILSDARSYYDIEYTTSYQEEVDNIRNINNIEEIEEIFRELEIKIEQLFEERSYSELTNKVIDLIHEDFYRDLRLKEVAEELFVNAMYLGQIFKRDTNQTFSQYLNIYRMKKAEELLIKTMKNINEVAQEVGYSSSGYFYKNFKEMYGVTPKDFRDKYLNIS